jgi:hypothetical protein
MKWVLDICSGKVEFKMTFTCYRVRPPSRPADGLERVHFIRADIFGQIKGLWQTSGGVLLLLIDRWFTEKLSDYVPFCSI